jgi:quercetin dioxygenase-like cupin family protein
MVGEESRRAGVELDMTNSNSETYLKPLVIDLPLKADDYFEILGKKNASRMRSGLVTLQSGGEVGSHNTEDYEELIVVLEGSGEVETAGVGRRPLAYGQTAYNPPHTQHNVINTGTGILRYIYIVSKAE